ncbi:MAG: tRNA pseudouridine(38-40) synthase TruA [Clostridia bacterium]|nr:tRNA pseudouridine(38-40) synthase TruA [Clostridia bacterium]
MKTAFVMSYLGTAYHGWQRQKNALTVQEVMEETLARLCARRPAVSGCGRTDAGVHAEYYVASADIETGVPLDRMPLALGSLLPKDVSVRRAIAVPEDFDARFSCKSKEYTYRIHNSRVRDPFYADRAYFFPQRLDERAMAEAAQGFVGKRDFAAVKSEGSPVKSTVRTVEYCRVRREGDMVLVSVRADGFLYNMVRAITGTLIYCGIGKLSPQDVPLLLAGGRREDTGPTAPACGLYMTDAFYGMEELDGQAGGAGK